VEGDPLVLDGDRRRHLPRQKIEDEISRTPTRHLRKRKLFHVEQLRDAGETLHMEHSTF
jgi:hypothetical protein